MKKILAIFCVFILSISLAACNEKNSDKESVDNQFISTLKKGLEERSDMVNKDPDNTRTISDAIELEISNLKPFEDKEFQNPEIKKLYKDYMQQLDIQKEYVVYYDDFNHYNQYKKFMDAYNERSRIISTLQEKFDLDLNPELAEEFKNNYAKVKQINDTNNSLVESLNKADFQVKEDGYQVSGNVKNETGKSIKNKEIKAKFINKDGVTVYTSSEFIDTEWENGETRNITFYLEGNKKFDKIEFHIEDY